MTTDKRQELLDKIRKLNAKAKGTSNEHEAAAFAQKAADLCSEYNLSIEEAERAEYGDIGRRAIPMMYSDPWRINIYSSCAHLYFCKVWIRTLFHQGKPRKGLGMAGTDVNMEICMQMAEYLIDTTLRLAREYSSERSARLGFERGCGDRLASRVYKLYLEAKKPQEQAPSVTGTALVTLYNQLEARVNDSLADLGLVIKKSRGSTWNDHSVRGARAANEVGLNTQIANPSRPRIA